MKTTKKESRSMKRMKRLMKRLCGGLKAVAGLDTVIKGKVDKFGPMVVLIAIGLMAATSAKAQVGWDGAGARERIRGEGPQAVSDFARGYRDYVSSRDGVHTILDALNGHDPYGANAIARSMEHTGAAGTMMGNPGDLGFVSGTYSGIATGALSGYHYTTVCSY